MSDESDFDQWRVVIRPPHDNPSEDQVLDCLMKAWTSTAARVLRAQLDGAAIYGKASAQTAIAAVMEKVWVELAQQLLSSHMDSERVRALFTPAADEQVQVVTRDERGRIAEVRTRRAG